MYMQNVHNAPNLSSFGPGNLFVSLKIKFLNIILMTVLGFLIVYLIFGKQF